MQLTYKASILEVLNSTEDGTILVLDSINAHILFCNLQLCCVNLHTLALDLVLL